MNIDELRYEINKKNCYLLSRGVSDADLQKLRDYVDTLSEKECEIYLSIRQSLYDSKTLGNKRIKITSNAIKLCVKLAECGHKTFPYIEKLATKGWSTSGGTYSFSMPLLKTGLENNIYSFGPIEKLVKKDASLDIGFGYFGALEVDFK